MNDELIREIIYEVRDVGCICVRENEYCECKLQLAIKKAEEIGKKLTIENEAYANAVRLFEKEYGKGSFKKLLKQRAGGKQ